MCTATLSLTSASGRGTSSSNTDSSSKTVSDVTGIAAPTDVTHSGPSDITKPPIVSGDMARMSAATDRFGLPGVLLVPVPTTMPGAPSSRTDAPGLRYSRRGSFSTGLISPHPLTLAPSNSGTIPSPQANIVGTADPEGFTNPV